MSKLSTTDPAESMRWVESDLPESAGHADRGHEATDNSPQRVGCEAELLGKSLKDPVEVLARTLWGEARGEGKRGMEAVANVVCNRADNPRWWGRSIVQVCLKPWQFSSWNPDDINRRKLLAVTDADRQFRIAVTIAKIAIAGELEDITYNADHFHTYGVRPVWSNGEKPVAAIGRHRFFRLELRGR